MTWTVRLSPGDPAPAFSLPDADGATVSLGDYRGRARDRSRRQAASVALLAVEP